MGGRALIDSLLNKPSIARGYAASQWMGAGGGALQGAEKDEVRGGGCRRRLSGCCSMAEKPPVL